jgi:lipoate-protein ligase A
MTAWHLVREGRCPSRRNMEQDLSLFQSVLSGSHQGVFRVYNWDEPAITTGHHQKGFAPHDTTLSLPILRRPTGGGAVLHLDDLTFSISAPENGPFPGGIVGACRHVSGIFARAMRRCGLDVEMRGDSASFSEVCFTRSSPVELRLEGGKILGLALLRRAGHLLVQGVIPLRVDRELDCRVFGHSTGFQGLCDRHPGLRPEGIIDELFHAFASESDFAVSQSRHDEYFAK